MLAIRILFLCWGFSLAQDAYLSRAPFCPNAEAYSKAKKKDQALLRSAIEEALDSAHCVAPLHQILGENNKHWKALRRELPIRQPSSLYHLYGTRHLNHTEMRQIFTALNGLDSSVCKALWDSAASKLFDKDWIAKPHPFDTSDGLCKWVLRDTLISRIEQTARDSATLRRRLLDWYPDTWWVRFGTDASEEEKVRYITHASLKNPENCSLADWMSLNQIAAAGLHANACVSYLSERFGPAITMLRFRKNYKPDTLRQIANKLSSLSSFSEGQLYPFLDTLEILLGTGEAWDVLDSLETIILEWLAKNPAMIKAFKEPTAPMLFAAFNAQLSLICDFPVSERLITKLFLDRYQNDLPLPASEELAKLQECLKPEQLDALRQVLKSIGYPPQN